LRETLGVILFQEQVLQVAVSIAGYTPGQAENLRRALGKKRSKQAIEALRDAFLLGAEHNGIARPDALQIFECLRGFAGYGFCKSHALAFAYLSYLSAWLRFYHPAQFFTALLNNQPMGFYPSEVLIRDAKRLGIAILPVDVNQSQARCAVECHSDENHPDAASPSRHSIRLGLLQVKGMSLQKAEVIEIARKDGLFRSLADFAQRTQLSGKVIEHLIQAGAMDNFGAARRELLWGLWIHQHWSDPNGLIANLIRPKLSPPQLPISRLWDRLQEEYRAMGFSVAFHPMQLLREQLQTQQVQSADQLAELANGAQVKVAGVVVCMQRPPAASGVAFLLLEDESGLINVVISPSVYEEYREIFKLFPMVYVEGRLQCSAQVINVQAERFERLEGDTLASNSVAPPISRLPSA
jgi:error-prone DNA polymerase